MHHQKRKCQCEHRILKLPVVGPIEHAKVKGNLGNNRKNKDSKEISPEIGGVYKTFYQKKGKEGETEMTKCYEKII